MYCTKHFLPSNMKRFTNLILSVNLSQIFTSQNSHIFDKLLHIGGNKMTDKPNTEELTEEGHHAEEAHTEHADSTAVKTDSVK